MKVYVDCAGCEQRELDAQRIINYLDANGIDITDEPGQCDYAFIVTCAVVKSSEEESVSRSRDVYSRIGDSAKVIVGGCLPSISPGRLAEYGVHKTISPRELESIDSMFGDMISVPMSEISYPNRSVFDNHAETSPDMQNPRDEYEIAKNGFKLRIDSGCLGNCSYCMIRSATGKLYSEPMEDLLKQFSAAVSNGEKTVMLMGGDTGAYGIDIGTNFFALLDNILGVPGDYNIFIHDFNVNWLIRDLERYHKLLQSSKGSKIRAANFPIQSGSNKVLELMRRPYRVEEAVSALKATRNSSLIKMGTHVMVGFPGESEKDFDATLDMLDDVDFDFITCFPYSEHEGADSARLPGKVDRTTIESRIGRIPSHIKERVKVIGD